MRLLIHIVLSMCLACTVFAAEVVEVEISGVEGAVLDNVRAFLGLARHDSRPLLANLSLPGSEKTEKELTSEDLQRLYRRSREEILLALQPFGYYDPEIDSSLDRQDDRWIASFRIDTGPAIFLADIDIRIEGQGRQDPLVLEALKSGQLHAGLQLNHGDYADTKQSLLKAALAAGYLDASYSRAELRIFPELKQAQVELVLETGSRYYFGSVTIEQDILDPQFIHRYVHFREGEPFDTDVLLKLQLALGDSGYFNQVEVQAQREKAVNYHIPVVIMTTPAKPRQYAYGLGFGTDTGPRATLATVFRRINDQGHSVLADIRVSRIAQSVGMQYKFPIGNLVSDRLVFKASADFEDVAGKGNTNIYTIGVSHNIEWGPLQRRLYLNFRHEDFSLGEESRTTNNLIPGITLSQLRTDNVLFPRQGFSWNVDLRGSAGVISDTAFVRSQATGRYVQPVGEKGRLLLRGQLGGTAVENFAKMPASERFFAGGDQSVRGYGYQKLGPTDKSGDIIGGRYLVVGSIEFDYLFMGDFGAAVFVDSGNADDNIVPSLKTGAGIGLRWRSPVGMLRFDIAHPFDDSSNDYRIHISIGPEL